MNRLSRALILFIAQGAFSGRSPVAPGTAGTLVGVLIYLGIKSSGLFLYSISALLVCIAGVWSAGRAEKILGCKDCSSIVIDEITGYLITMFLVPGNWGFIIAGFVLFRLFDIVKPWPLQGLQKMNGGIGVMLDDIGAGVYSNVLLQAGAYLINKF